MTKDCMKRFLVIISIVYFLFVPKIIFADDTAITNGLEYLKSKQDDSGKITGGFSAPSQWSAIAFSANGVDVSIVKKSTNSLKDFLQLDIPSNNTATDWETRILANVAINENPFSINGTNYVAHLESFYNSGQIGDTCSLNDDIFGLLALIAGNSTSTQIKQDTLNFLIAQQDSDGGFGFSAPGCDWYSTSADMTGAGIQALISARDNEVTSLELDGTIEKAKQYLLKNQNSDGGFGYFGSSDTDTTGWVLMGLNALEMQSTEQAVKARNYLLSQQSNSDGGFMAFDYGTNTFLSNATTTAQTLIALSGQYWLLHVYDPSKASLPVSTTNVIMTPTPTPTSGLRSIDQETIITKTITVTTTPSPKKYVELQEQSSVSKEILGDESIIKSFPKSKDKITIQKIAHTRNYAFLSIAFGSFLAAVSFLFFKPG